MVVGYGGLEEVPGAVQVMPHAGIPATLRLDVGRDGPVRFLCQKQHVRDALHLLAHGAVRGLIGHGIRRALEPLEEVGIGAVADVLRGEGLLPKHAPEAARKRAGEGGRDGLFAIAVDEGAEESAHAHLFEADRAAAGAGSGPVADQWRHRTHTSMRRHGRARAPCVHGGPAACVEGRGFRKPPPVPMDYFAEAVLRRPRATRGTARAKAIGPVTRTTPIVQDQEAPARSPAG